MLNLKPDIGQLATLEFRRAQLYDAFEWAVLVWEDKEFSPSVKYENALAAKKECKIFEETAQDIIGTSGLVGLTKRTEIQKSAPELDYLIQMYALARMAICKLADFSDRKNKDPKTSMNYSISMDGPEKTKQGLTDMSASYMEIESRARDVTLAGNFEVILEAAEHLKIRRKPQPAYEVPRAA